MVLAWVGRGSWASIGAFILKGAATTSLVLGGAACVAAPPGPRGPLRGTPGIELAGDASLALSSARATHEDGTTASGTADHFFHPLTIAPRRVELRAAPLAWLDLGFDYGWVDSGVDLRVGLPAAPNREWALHFSGGLRTSKIAVLDLDRPQHSAWGRIEAYPLVYDTTGRLVLALGLDAGAFYHGVHYNQRATEGPTRVTIEVIRDELRLESAVGYVWTGPRGSTLIGLEPYLVLDSGAPQACKHCNAATYEQSFGVVFVVRVAVFIPSVRSER